MENQEKSKISWGAILIVALAAVALTWLVITLVGNKQIEKDATEAQAQEPLTLLNRDQIEGTYTFKLVDGSQSEYSTASISYNPETDQYLLTIYGESLPQTFDLSIDGGGKVSCDKFGEGTATVGKTDQDVTISFNNDSLQCVLTK